MKTMFWLVVGSMELASCNVLVFTPGELRTLPEDEWIPSKVEITQQPFSKQDRATVYGYTSGTYVKDQETHTDKLAYMEVQFIRMGSKDTVVLTSDEDGQYKASLAPGKYKLYVANPGFCRLSVQELNLNAGEVKKIDVLMGQGRGTNAYVADGNDQLTIVPYRNH